MDPPEVMKLEWPKKDQEPPNLVQSLDNDAEEPKHLRFTFHNTNIWLFLSGALITLLILTLLFLSRKKS
jgi:LPXTG-motif cell wall-anchored protein